MVNVSSILTYSTKINKMKVYLDSIQKDFHPYILEKYNVLQINSNDIGNCYELEFEGSEENLRRFYNKYFNTGESFDNYIK
jgi:hypothetical protein